MMSYSPGETTTTTTTVREQEDDDESPPSYWDAVNVLREQLNSQEGSHNISSDVLKTRTDLVAVFPPKYEADDRERHGTPNRRQLRGEMSSAPLHPRPQSSEYRLPSSRYQFRGSSPNRREFLAPPAYSTVQPSNDRKEGVEERQDTSRLPVPSAPVPEDEIRPRPSAPDYIPNTSEDFSSCETEVTASSQHSDVRDRSQVSNYSLPGAHGCSRRLLTFAPRVGPTSPYYVPEACNNDKSPEKSECPLAVHFEEMKYVLDPNCVQTTIKWRPPANADQFLFMTYKVQMFRLSGLNPYDWSKWDDITECSTQYLRIYRVNDVIIMGKKRLTNLFDDDSDFTSSGKNELILTLRIRADGVISHGISSLTPDSRLRSKYSDGLWSDNLSLIIRRS